MGKIVTGTVVGTDADIYVCCGFMPDRVLVRNIENANEQDVVWDRHMGRAAEGEAGWIVSNSTRAPITTGAGIALYKGGDYISAASIVYLVKDPSPDKRAAGTGSVIDTWTIDTPASFTGHWNDVCNTTFVGEGSLININGEWYNVISVTSNGEQADEVLLDRLAPSGPIYALMGMFDFIGAAAGVVTPAGFFIDSTCAANNANETCYFEAELRDYC